VKYYKVNKVGSQLLCKQVLDYDYLHKWVDIVDYDTLIEDRLILENYEKENTNKRSLP
jgi:hypothetical protein